MNDNAKLWVEALRSGQYKQGKAYLKQTEKFRHKNRYCCLGVACELYQRSVGGLTVDESGPFVTFDERFGVLPGKVSEWVGLASSSGDFYDHMNSLTHLNDNGTPFVEIASLIEGEPVGLFVEET